METTGERDRERAAVDRLLADGLEVDLPAPPSRADLALPEGTTSTVLQAEDQEPFEATVRFSDGTELRTPAGSAVVASLGPDAPPSSLVLVRSGLTLDELAAVLRSAVSDLGADEAAVDSYLAAAPRASERTGDLIRTVLTRLDGTEELVLEVVTTQAEGRIQVNYMVAWGEETAPVAGAGG